jgi:hypothetical protein
MSFRHTWFWVLLAAGLFAFLFFFPRHRPDAAAGPGRVLPELRSAAVTAVQVRPAAPVQLGIRAERTNGHWQLTQPIVYPAHASNVDRLLGTLETLTPATYLKPDELRGRPRAEQEFGFASPQASILLQQGDYRAHILVGALTAPGDQVFVQVVGREGVFVTDAQWLSCLPKSPNDWRDPALILGDLKKFDRLAVTNNSRAFVLERDGRNLWRMVWPLSSARADNTRIDQGLRTLESLQIRQFVSDDPKAEAEGFGLAPAALEVSFGRGTNVEMLLQFGKPTPGATNLVYGRRAGQDSIFTVEAEPLAPWRSSSVNDFRDPRLLTLTSPVTAIDVVAGEERFSLQRGTNESWRVLPDNYSADPEMVREFVAHLTSLPVAQFTKDVVNAPDWPEFGLAPPARQYLVKGTGADSAASPTNDVIAELSFGVVTNQPDRVYARRADESSVYAVATNEFAKLPSTSLHFRDRRFWNFSEEEVAGAVIRREGQTRELVRNGPHQWAFAQGSQGIINDLAVEATVRGLAQTSAVEWVGRGEGSRQACGLAGDPYQVSVKLKNGQTLSLQFGSEAPSKNQYAAIVLDGQLWVFELSWILYRDISSYLSVP